MSAGCATRSTSSKSPTTSSTRSASRRATSRSSYDVIIVPNQGGSGKRLVFDIENRGQPIRVQEDRTSSRTSAMYGESDDITGGMGLEGVAEFEKFVKAGGVLVTLGTASYLPGRVRPRAARRCGADVRAVLLARRDHRRGDPAAGASDFLRVRQEDHSGALRQRAAADRADRTRIRSTRRRRVPPPTPAGRADAVPGRR